jgi:16S rRNA processing protein RimM
VSAGQLTIGAVVGPQGIRGQFKVKPFTAIPQSLSAYGPVTTDNGQQLMLKIMSVNSKGLAIVRAKGVDTREAAEALRGVTLYVVRDSLPDPDDGEFYHADLLGMVVRGQDGAKLGSLLAIHDFGAGEIAELAPVKGPTIMVPFGGDRLIAVDLATKELCLSVPDGLLEDVNAGDKTGENKPASGAKVKRLS